jgi:transcriptional regulator with XRE-family HTH domain
MNMNFNDESTNLELASLFSFNDEKEEMHHEATMLMFKFLEQIEKIGEKKAVKKKDLAKMLGTSASYITQLYNGDKLINLVTLAKFQKAYDLTFEIKAKLNKEAGFDYIDSDMGEIYRTHISEKVALYHKKSSKNYDEIHDFYADYDNDSLDIGKNRKTAL